ncbi:aminotransferase class I and II [Roseibium sp. TrichSKD4]|nr:aminotransferase class I and II [Roseibium sp. TrichSKD4]
MDCIAIFVQNSRYKNGIIAGDQNLIAFLDFKNRCLSGTLSQENSFLLKRGFGELIITAKTFIWPRLLLASPQALI